MRELQFISPTDLRDFAKSLGWVPLPEAQKDRIYVLQNDRFPRRQLIFPMDTSVSDYLEVVQLIVEKLSEMESQPVETILAWMQNLRDDTLCFRILTERDEAAIPLSFAASVLGGAEEMLLASASTVLHPQRHHPRLGRMEARRLVELASFRHTEHGSFVLKVACPVRGMDVQTSTPSAKADMPFVRRATLTLCQSVSALVDAIEADRLDALVEETRRDPQPLLSSNLCEALTQFQDPRLNNALEFEIAWALSLPGKQGRSWRTRLQHDYFGRIDEVRQALRVNASHNEDTFIGTVEHLGGEMGMDGRRSGDVLLALLLAEGVTVKASVILDAEQYAQASQAHMTNGAYVKIRGKLMAGRQPRALTDVTHFEIILPDG